MAEDTTVTALAYRLLLVLMRDRSLHPDVRMDAAHIALFLEHLDERARADFDDRALRALMPELSYDRPH